VRDEAEGRQSRQVMQAESRAFLLTGGAQIATVCVPHEVVEVQIWNESNVTLRHAAINTVEFFKKAAINMDRIKMPKGREFCVTICTRRTGRRVARLTSWWLFMIA
jgi:hypothetical protein